MLTRMKRLAVSALVFAIAVAACGGTSSGPTSWSGPTRPYPDDGVLAVDEFNDYADTVEGDWQRDPEQLAFEFTRAPNGDVTVDGDRVTLLRPDLEDDSVRAERYVLELRPDGDEWRLASARWEQRCHVGRGHQEFSPELCI
jgi:hypothetical protein